ncbi:MAG: helix-turn-helix transcriptional regulator [Verrucomicrobiia bacterium]
MSSKVSNSIGQWRSRREGGKGISKAHLARRIGVSRSHVVRLEQGKVQPSAKTMFRIARYFGCRIEELFQFPEGS